MRISSECVKYAQTLADVAKESGQLDQVEKELLTLVELLRTHVELSETLLNPAIPFQAKRNIVEQVAETMVLQSLVVNFVLVLLEHARLDRFQEVAQAYQAVVDKSRGVVRAEASSPQEWVEDQRKDFEENLSKATGRTIKLAHHVDESLIAGVKLQIGSTVYDGSISAQLERIRYQLSAQ